MGGNDNRGYSYQTVPQNEQNIVEPEDGSASNGKIDGLLDGDRGVDMITLNQNDVAKDPLLLRPRISPLQSIERSRSKIVSAFESEGLEDHYAPTTGYEGAHRYDPEFDWEPHEEKRLVRKLDWRICAWVCLTFAALMLDRGNIIHALSGNMLNDIGLNTDDYDVGLAVFSFFFLVAELPSQLLSKWIGAERWIPVQIVCWSFASACQAFITGRTSFLVCRALVGLFEGGFIPNNILYLSYYYTTTELPMRLSYFWGAYSGVAIVSAFMMYAVFHMDGFGGIEGWRWLFAIEGAFTLVIGIVTFFYLPPSPTQTKGRLRGDQGWFTSREEKIMVNRILRDDPSKGDMHNRQHITWAKLKECFKDYDMWPLYLIAMLWMVPSYPMSQYLTILLKEANGFDTFAANLLSIPAYLIFVVNIIFWTWLSEKLNERLLLSMIGQLWCLPLLIALDVLNDGANQWTRYTFTVLLVGVPFVQTIYVAMTSRNAGSVRTRTVSAAVFNMFVQTSSIIGASIYREDDKPYYHSGNKVLIGLVFLNLFIIGATKWYYVRKNRHRERIWSAMTREEKEKYLQTTTDEGNRRLDFRFTH